MGGIDWELYPCLQMEYANMMTLDIIAKYPYIPLPTYILRALMKQIFEGMRAFHSSGLVHRDIKCDNILLHSPPGSGRVHAKISDFGFAKKVDLNNKQTYFAGTIPFMSPEQFYENPIITQKVDIYALGITFYKLFTHQYPVNERNFKEQGKKMSQLKCIKRPLEIKDNLLWDLLSRLLKFDPDKRISAAEALQHPYFTSPEALSDISKEQQDLASLAAVAELEGDSSITEFDKDPTFIVSESIIKQFILNYIQRNQPKQLNNIEKQKNESQIEEIQTIYKLDETDNEEEMIELAKYISLQNDDSNEQNKQINRFAECLIGCLYFRTPLPIEFRSEIINCLKEPTQSNDEIMNQFLLMDF
ncbi:MAG: putative serine/threonine protein kinase [Streblomastix strix]|uniref:Putative serine/threonine protein kinase n=1 Tax=Streblomastix strix TaxID=222440 RepID=A0A5J4VBW1_9EUKA|nr:MAG: putative serine/threonine protein kinase [Streblomastix strix]